VKHKILFVTICLISAFWPLLIFAQGRTVIVNPAGELLAPSNFYEANPVQTTGGPLYPHFLTLDSYQVYRHVVGSTSTNTVVDAVLETWTVTQAIREHQITIPYIRNATGATVNYSSSNEAVATVDQTGRATFVSTGEALITAELAGYEASISREFSDGYVTAWTNIIGGATGWVRKEITDNVVTALTADAGANDDELFDTRDWVAHTYVRNASCWAYATTGGTAPWTGIAVWATGKTGTGAQAIRGTVISPDIVVFADHNAPVVGRQFKWLGSDNVIHTRTLISRLRLGASDAAIGRLNEALPAAVVPLKLLPTNYEMSFYTVGKWGLQLPAINVNRNLQASVHQIRPGWYSLPPQNALMAPYYQTPVSGDSGSPIVMVIDDQLVLAFTWHTPWAGSGFSQVAVNAAVATLGGIEPSAIDLSDYNNTIPSF